MKKIAFIVHGKIKKREKILAQIKEVFIGNYSVSFFITEQPGQTVPLTCNAIQKGNTYIICIGGDGSLNEVANGIMKAISDNIISNGNEIYLGILPAGTGNDFVKTTGISFNLHELKKYIDANSCLAVDLGLVHFKSKTNEDTSRYFINITDVGMGGMVAEKLSKASKWLGATFTYQKAILTTLFSYKNQWIKVKADSFSFEGKMMNFIIANGKYFGSGLGIAPQAQPDDGKFSIIILGEVSLLDYVQKLGDIKKCQIIQHPNIAYHTAQQIDIETPRLPIDMDGEFIGYSPMKISITTRAIKLLC